MTSRGWIHNGLLELPKEVFTESSEEDARWPQKRFSESRVRHVGNLIDIGTPSEFRDASSQVHYSGGYDQERKTNSSLYLGASPKGSFSMSTPWKDEEFSENMQRSYLHEWRDTKMMLHPVLRHPMQIQALLNWIESTGGPRMYTIPRIHRPIIAHCCALVDAWRVHRCFRTWLASVHERQRKQTVLDACDVFRTRTLLQKGVEKLISNRETRRQRELFLKYERYVALQLEQFRCFYAFGKLYKNARYRQVQRSLCEFEALQRKRKTLRRLAFLTKQSHRHQRLLSIMQQIRQRRFFYAWSRFIIQCRQAKARELVAERWFLLAHFERWRQAARAVHNLRLAAASFKMLHVSFSLWSLYVQFIKKQSQRAGIIARRRLLSRGFKSFQHLIEQQKAHESALLHSARVILVAWPVFTQWRRSFLQHQLAHLYFTNRVLRSAWVRWNKAHEHRMFLQQQVICWNTACRVKKCTIAFNDLRHHASRRRHYRSLSSSIIASRKRNEARKYLDYWRRVYNIAVRIQQTKDKNSVLQRRIIFRQWQQHTKLRRILRRQALHYAFSILADELQARRRHCLRVYLDCWCRETYLARADKFRRHHSLQKSVHRLQKNSEAAHRTRATLGICSKYIGKKNTQSLRTYLRTLKANAARSKLNAEIQSKARNQYRHYWLQVAWKQLRAEHYFITTTKQIELSLQERKLIQAMKCFKQRCVHRHRENTLAKAVQGKRAKRAFQKLRTHQTLNQRVQTGKSLLQNLKLRQAFQRLRCCKDRSLSERVVFASNRLQHVQVRQSLSCWTNFTREKKHRRTSDQFHRMWNLRNGFRCLLPGIRTRMIQHRKVLVAGFKIEKRVENKQKVLARLRANARISVWLKQREGDVRQLRQRRELWRWWRYARVNFLIRTWSIYLLRRFWYAWKFEAHPRFVRERCFHLLAYYVHQRSAFKIWMRYTLYCKRFQTASNICTSLEHKILYRRYFSYWIEVASQLQQEWLAQRLRHLQAIFKTWRNLALEALRRREVAYSYLVTVAPGLAQRCTTSREDAIFVRKYLQRACHAQRILRRLQDNVSRARANSYHIRNIKEFQLRCGWQRFRERVEDRKNIRVVTNTLFDRQKRKYWLFWKYRVLQYRLRRVFLRFGWRRFARFVTEERNRELCKYWSALKQICRDRHLLREVVNAWFNTTVQSQKVRDENNKVATHFLLKSVWKQFCLGVHHIIILRKAFSCWAVRVSTVKRLRQELISEQENNHRAARHWSLLLRRRVWRALQVWRSQSHDMSVQYYKQRLLKQSFSTWKLVSSRQHEFFANARHAHLLRIGWDALVITRQLARERQSAIRTMSERWAHVQLKFAFQHIRCEASASQAYEFTLQSRLTKKRLQRHFSCWATLTSYYSTLGRRYIVAEAHHRRVLLQRVFLRLRAYWQALQ